MKQNEVINIHRVDKDFFSDSISDGNQFASKIRFAFIERQ